MSCLRLTGFKAAVSSAVTAICLALPVLGKTLYVAPPGQSTPSAPYGTEATAASSIQVAVNAAADSDLVLVLPGTYLLTTDVVIKEKGVTVRSRDGRDTTIVNAQGLTRGFYINHTEASVEGLTIRNGVAPASPLSGDTYGGGVYIEDGGSVRNCIIEDCSAKYGGGVRIRFIGAVQDSILRRNSASISGGGIQTAYGGNVSRVTLHNNTAVDKGGGIYCFDGGEITESTIYANQAFYGGGVRLYYDKTARPKVSRSRIYNNKAVRRGSSSGAGGGVQIELGGTAENCLIYDNEADAYGGGVHIYKTGASIGAVVNCSISHNRTKDTTGDGNGDGSGGGLYTSNGGLLLNSIIYYNQSALLPNRNSDDTAAAYRNCLTSPSLIGNGNLFAQIPQYVDPDGRNYYLRLASPCIDAGSNTGAPAVDFNGTARPLIGKTNSTARVSDLGAYEFFEVDDVDLDGMPTWWEQQYGLNPNSPIDATGDLDGDGLNNLNEYKAGTIPTNPDTDADGLTDGQEVNGVYSALYAKLLKTNPLLPDSDGDGFRDKFESDNHTDPTDVLSFPATLSGSVTYSGTLQTNGPVRISVASSGMTTRSAVLPALGAYSITNVPTKLPLTITAYRDGNGPGGLGFTNAYDAWEPSGAYAGNPLTLAGAQSGVNMVLADPATDTDTDGLPDYQEIFVYRTLHTNADTDNDGMRDDWEVQYTLNPLSAADAGLDPDSDTLTNLQEYARLTNPRSADTDGDGMPDGWEAQYSGALNPLVVDGTLDYDSDTLTNLREYQVGTSPISQDTDGDTMPDGWEARYMPVLDPKVSDAAGDPDFDSLSNLQEHQVGTDPTNPDTDGDGMSDGWEAQYIPSLSPLVDDAAGDPDMDLLVNFEEYLQGTDPTKADTDGDGVNDGEEVAVGTDPLDPLSYPVRIAGTLSYSGMQTGLFHVVASQDPTGLVYSVIVTNAGPYVIRNAANTTYYTVLAYLDSNGNATQETWEASGALSDTNGVPLVLYLTNQVSGADIALDDPPTDGDSDGLRDYDEVYVHHTDPRKADTDGDGMPDGWEVDNGLDPLNPNNWNVDTDVDGLKNLDEYFNRTDPNDPDTDGDGLTDGLEVLTHLTNPLISDTDGDGLTDYDEVMVFGTNPLLADTDGDSFPDAQELQLGTNPLDPLSFPATISGTVTYVGTQTGMIHVAATAGTNVFATALAVPGPYSLTNVPTRKAYMIHAYMDTDGDQVQDTWEARDIYTGAAVTLTNNLANADMMLVHPPTDTDGDGLTDYDEVIVHGTNPSNPDSDGDLMPDGWEVQNSLDPLGGDAAGDPDVDTFANLAEYQAGTDPNNPDTDGDGMPDGWEAQYRPTLNPLFIDAASDPDGDTLTNLQEFGLGTNPTRADTDGDGSRDSREAVVGSNPLDPLSYPIRMTGRVTYVGAQTGTVYLLAQSVGGVVSNALTMSGTSVVYNVSNLISRTDYTIHAYRDSVRNGQKDLWEPFGSYTKNPILQPTNTLTGINVAMANPTTDTDGDGLTDYAERFVHNTDPLSADTDGDGMPDGWEVQYTLNPRTNDATGDPDLDNLVNLAEYQATTHPKNADTDADGMPDGWEVTHGLQPRVNDAAGDFDTDLLTNLQEYGLGTQPNNADTDGDLMPDGWEVRYKPPLNPLADDAAGDPDADTLLNLAEYRAGTNPKVADTDGDGRNDGFEVQWKSNPLNRASFPVTMSGSILNATVAPQTGTVYIVLNLQSNANLFAPFSIGSVTNGNPRPFTVQYVPTLSNYWISAFMDLSGDGNRDNWEPYGVAFNGTNSITPTNNFNAGLIPLVDSMLDSDGDGLMDFEEVTIYGTDPNKADSDDDGFGDAEEVLVYNTDPLEGASFPASISGSVSYTNTQSGPLLILVTNSVDSFTYDLGPYTDGPYSTLTNLPTLVDYHVVGFIDSNTNGVLELWEARGVPSGSPFTLTANVTGANMVIEDPSGDSDGDSLTDYEEFFVYFTNPNNPDTDSDLMPDGWEVHFSLVTNAADASFDIEPDGLTSLAEYQYSLSVLVAGFDPADGLDPTEDDTDNDTLTDGDEVDVFGTDPLKPDTDDDGMLDGWESQYVPDLNPLVGDAAGDPDGDTLTNIQELGRGTDPTNPDTDGDGLEDGDEVNVYLTDPAKADTDDDKFTDHEEIVGIGSDPLNILDPVVVDDDAPADPVKNDPNNTNYLEEDGSSDFPYDSIREGINAAQIGFVVLVQDGEYKSTGNVNINTLAKAITIRSRNGYAFTKILTDIGNGFVVNSGEGTNTVIQGFTIQTRVEDLGSAGILVDGASLIIRECRFFDCGEAGLLVQNEGRPQILDCLFEENQGAVKIVSSHPQIERSTIRFNNDDFGGGLWITGTSEVTSQPVIVNCLIVRNKATDTGGGVYAGAHTRAVFVNTTIADNDAQVRGGGIYNAGDTKFWNGILWGNTAPVGPGFSLDLAFETSYCCMQTARPTSIGVIVANPRFAGTNDYSLRGFSPCIDQGTDNPPYTTNAPSVDIRGLPRPLYVSKVPGYDLGAYEYQPGGALSVQGPGGSAGELVDAGLPGVIRWTYEGSVGTNLVLEYTYNFLNDPGLVWTLISSNVNLGAGGVGSSGWTVPATNSSRIYVRVSDAANPMVTGISPFSFGTTNGIQLYAPDGGGSYYLGRTMNVAWASSPATNTLATLEIANVALGTLMTNVEHVAGGVTNSFGWVLDSAAYLTTNGLMRVSSGALRPGVSAGVFSIRGLAVTHPLSGTVQTGMPVNVRWTSLGAGAAVDIAYSGDGGGSYVTVANGVANVNGTNLFVWTVPLTVTTNARLRISSPTDVNIVGRSGSFEITHLGGYALNLAGDRIPDLWKIAQGLDPENLDGLSGAEDDPDGDGASNYHEWLAGTGALDGESYLGILSLDGVSSGAGGLAQASGEGGGFVLRWKTVPGRRYVVEAASQPGGVWGDVSRELEAAGAELVWTDAGLTGRRYFRIRVLVE